jgi:hypothetical protein
VTQQTSNPNRTFKSQYLQKKRDIQQTKHKSPPLNRHSLSKISPSTNPRNPRSHPNNNPRSNKHADILRAALNYSTDDAKYATLEHGFATTSLIIESIGEETGDDGVELEGGGVEG